MEVTGHYADSPLNIGAVRWTHEDDLRLKPRRRPTHPKTRNASYVSRVPWADLIANSEPDSSVDFREIGARARGWTHELEDSEAS